MQFAQGARTSIGRAFHKVSENPPGIRAIHTPSLFRVPQPISQANTAQKLFSQTKTIFGRFVAHLATPGHIGTSAPLHNASSLVSSGRATIQQGYSLPVRHAMTPRPFGAYHLPKPPSVQRSVFQVGLGTARNFHSARPVFQNLVQNVPVVGRAFCEADWQIKVKQEKQKSNLAKKRSTKKKTKEMMKPIEKKVATAEAEEFDHYFAAPAVPEMTTYLLIPLAPTPTARNPLPASPSPSLLPIAVLLDIHASHELHSLRVSSLFARLDVSQVWTNPGVSCSVYGDPSGLASILKVEFRGWSEAEVRAILGEAGTGWCVLEEVTEDEVGSPSLSGVSTPLTGIEDDVDSFFSSDS